jgi:hypothetical protein
LGTHEIDWTAGARPTDHVRPFHNSENGVVVSLEEVNELAEPTATQRCGEAHATPSIELASPPSSAPV